MALRSASRTLSAFTTRPAFARLQGAASRAPPRPRPSRSSSVACMATAAGPKYHLLSYTYVPDILERRGPHREAHLAAARQHLEAGRLVAAGAVGDPVEGAMFFFKDISRADIEAFVAADPYFKNGLVPAYTIKPFAVVVGDP